MDELPPLPEPVAWQWLNGGHFRKYLPTSAERDAWTPLFSEAQIRECVAQAIATEREACAKACEAEVHLDGMFTAREFARAVRERKP